MLTILLIFGLAGLFTYDDGSKNKKKPRKRRDPLRDHMSEMYRRETGVRAPWDI